MPGTPVELAGGGHYHATTLRTKVAEIPTGVSITLKPVIEVVSAFLYRGRFTNYENTFETTEEPDYIVTLDTNAAPSRTSCTLRSLDVPGDELNVKIRDIGIRDGNIVVNIVAGGLWEEK
ncbi:hypothetical protein C8R45DRAFT_1176709 [Mycena sanguinolenta]|nr:hypothetical protein C8R45DRAFT_1176709 [Mycena sanguinolenta]